VRNALKLSPSYIPFLTFGRIAELEDAIGAGLLEEVIQVAEGELKLLDIMQEAEV